MPCHNIDVLIVLNIIFRPAPYQFFQRILLYLFSRIKPSKSGVYQKIIPVIDRHFLIDVKIFQKINDQPLHFAVESTEFLYRGPAPVILPCQQIIHHLLIQFLYGFLCNFRHKKFKTLYGHKLMVACQADRIGHFHDFQKRPDRMGPPVKDIAKNIQAVILFQPDLLKESGKQIIFSVYV